jgi:hypothetical protein
VALNEQGADYYSLGEYRRAVEKFIQAYALERDPNLLFNIANCYERLGDREAAVEKYDAFLAAPDLDPQGRLRAEQALTRLALPAPPASDDALASPPSATLVEDSASVDGASTFETVLPWAVLGSGAVISGVGLSLYLLGSRDHQEVTSAPAFGDPTRVTSMTRDRALDLVRSGNTKKTLGVTGLVLGGLAMAGVAAVVGWDYAMGDATQETSAPRLALSPDNGGATVSVVGSF